MNRKDALIIIGFIGIILASIVPIFRSPNTGFYITFFDYVSEGILIIKNSYWWETHLNWLW